MEYRKCQKFQKNYKYYNSSEKEAIIFLRLRQEGCKRKEALRFSSLNSCRQDSTRTYYGPPNYRILPVRQAPTYSLEKGWMEGCLTYDMEKEYALSYKDFIIEDECDDKLKKQFDKDEECVKQQYKEMLQIMSDYLNNIEEQFPLTKMTESNKKEYLTQVRHLIEVSKSSLQNRPYFQLANIKFYELANDLIRERLMKMKNGSENEGLVEKHNIFEEFIKMEFVKDQEIQYEAKVQKSKITQPRNTCTYSPKDLLSFQQKSSSECKVNQFFPEQSTSNQYSDLFASKNQGSLKEQNHTSSDNCQDTFSQASQNSQFVKINLMDSANLQTKLLQEMGQIKESLFDRSPSNKIHSDILNLMKQDRDHRILEEKFNSVQYSLTLGNVDYERLKSSSPTSSKSSQQKQSERNKSSFGREIRKIANQRIPNVLKNDSIIESIYSSIMSDGSKEYSYEQKSFRSSKYDRNIKSSELNLNIKREIFNENSEINNKKLNQTASSRFCKDMHISNYSIFNTTRNFESEQEQSLLDETITKTQEKSQIDDMLINGNINLNQMIEKKQKQLVSFMKRNFNNSKIKNKDFNNQQIVSKQILNKSQSHNPTYSQNFFQSNLLSPIKKRKTSQLLENISFQSLNQKKQQSSMKINKHIYLIK